MRRILRTGRWTPLSDSYEKLTKKCKAKGKSQKNNEQSDKTLNNSTSLTLENDIQMQKYNTQIKNEPSKVHGGQVKSKKVTVCAIFTVFAAIVGLLEGFLPLGFVIPVPGVKLGLANIFVVLAYSVYGPMYACGVSLLRVVIVFLFSGNPVSFLLSASGAAASFVGLLIAMRGAGKLFSYVGVSVICAFLHGAAQLAAAVLLVGTPCLYYMPVLCFFCSIAGIITGTLMNVLCVPAARMFEV